MLRHTGDRSGYITSVDGRRIATDAAFAPNADRQTYLLASSLVSKFVIIGSCEPWLPPSNGSREGGGDRPPKTYESNFIHHDNIIRD